ncbi:MAG: helix-turn-helix transcriptional regulator [Methanosarcina sp.]
MGLGFLVSPSLGIPFLEGSNITATVHGATYAWDTFEPLNDSVININSAPPQSIVAKNSTYSFELPPGTYTITAKCYENDTLIYSKETTLEIESQGNYVLDLLLYPVSENKITKTIPVEENDLENENTNSADFTKRTTDFSSTLGYLLISFIFLFLLGTAYNLPRINKRKKKSRLQKKNFNTNEFLLKVFGTKFRPGIELSSLNPENAASMINPAVEDMDKSEAGNVPSKKSPLSTEMREVLDIVRGHKGKITQKDLRSKLEYSEVKVSLMLSELEKKGLIKKFKNGRENIVILVKEAH